ncbi:U11/U12 small nuclear ribonucleoprotein 25 kDa protein-like [Daphnia carinata]|uniref:U11/U12 small nuclear ribonucleoprotein 25 kDa protein-like n=1 Tax=Daphnia carinata TaxID=120202 RepID=UPI00258083D9|nr:U11/U12 small nuclear ribonucleoprotein 25 kDa protein-like [Daphnia carinata]
MEVEEASSHRSKRKKERKHHKSKSKSKSKSKKKHRKRSRRSPSSSEESQQHSNVKASSLVNLANPEDSHKYSHQEVVDLVKKTLDSLLAKDPILNDLPPAVTLEEAQSLIALEHGQAIHIEIHRDDGTSFPVIISQNATVGQLKRSVERATELRLSRDRSSCHRRINWKYVWKTYWLYAQGIKLKDDMASLKDCAINNYDRVSFIKRLKEK